MQNTWNFFAVFCFFACFLENDLVQWSKRKVDITMLTNERRKLILDMLNEKGSIRVTDAAQALGVTTETIRSDIKALAEKGLAERQYGGATAVAGMPEISVDSRLMENYEAKKRIAQRALEYLTGDIIFIDSGSTLSVLASLLRMGPDKTIVTNSFKAAEIMMHTCDTLVFLGGEVNSTISATGGLWTSKTLDSINLDTAFIGTSGFASHAGPCTKTFGDALTKEQVVLKSGKRIVLADSTKFLVRAAFPYCKWNDIDVLITDSGAPQEAIRTLSGSVEIVVV